MNPVGRFLRVFLSPEQKTDSIRPGAIIKAEVIRPISSNLWLLQVGSRRFSAASTYNLLEISQKTGLEMKVEQAKDGLIFRLLHPPKEADSIQLLLQDLGFTENLNAYRSLIRIFMQLGMPLNEEHILPALQQLRRLLRDNSATRKKYHEAARLIAMFSDRGMHVPDEILISLVEPRHLQLSVTENSDTADQSDQDQSDQDQKEDQEKILFLPARYTATDKTSIACQLLNSCMGKSGDSWFIVPFAYGSLNAELQNVQGTIRIHMSQENTAGRVILDANSQNSEWGRWVFSWNLQDSNQALQVYWNHASSVTETQGLLEKLKHAIRDSGLQLPEKIQMLENWDGFNQDLRSNEEDSCMIKVDAYG